MDRSRQQSLLDEKAALERRLIEIDSEIAHINRANVESLHHSGRHNALVSDKKSGAPQQPLRQILIGMLSDVGYMLTNTTIRHLYEGKFQKGLSASRLGTLSFDEAKRKNKWNTTIYGLAHPIQLVNGEIIRSKNVWARSDWPISRRVYLPTTEKLINLHFLDWYVTASNSRRYKYLKSPTMLRYVEGMIDTLELSHLIQPPYDSGHVKKVIVQEIALTEELEKTKYSSLAFKILSAHKQSKKHYSPEMYGDTNMNVRGTSD